ncbi:MAG: hypothetical protein IIA02_10535 [Proteobacteria bacterium]|nr:hypothetical protein [Pseudomonadota bacterium]
MTEELKQAAQQAHTPDHIAGVDHAHELLRRMGYHRDGEWFIHANRRGAEAIHVSTISTIVSAGQLVITQRPAAQEVGEREGWTDADADAARLALELECLLLDTKDTASVSRWWASANEALDLHRARLAAAQAKEGGA